jgi:glycosyltransferase involved in cell wall biosynthesis
MKTILIGTSKFGSPVSDYYKELANVLIEDKNGIFYFTWPSKRPTKFKDFLFLYKIIKKYKPIVCLSNFGSTNVISIVSFLLKVKNRINYLHTTTKQINIDSEKSFKTRLLGIRKKYIYKLNTHFFTNSIGTKNDYVNSRNIDKNKITVFPLLIEKSKKTYNNYKNRDYSLVIIGRLHPSKGHKELIVQFSKCLEFFPKLKLKIIWDGYLENDLKMLAESLCISNNIIFMGRLPYEEVKIEFSKSLISISSSLEEAYGLVNIEALREGTPLICTKTAGSTDILNEGYNGEFFLHKNYKSLSLMLSKILNEWEKYSKNSLISFKNNYLVDNCMNNHKEKIISIINNTIVLKNKDIKSENENITGYR